MSQNSDSLPPPEVSPRHCHLEKWPDFNGYGFNLHAERGKAGQFIGKIDDNSPALKADLRKGDKIVEVNGVNVLNQNHHQVVTLIRGSGDKVDLLVVDAAAEEYYRKNNLVITSDATNVIYCEGKRTSNNGAINGTEEHIEHVETVVAVERTPEELAPAEPEQDYEPEEDLREKTPSPPPILDADEVDAAPVEDVITTEQTTVDHAEPELETPEPQQNGDTKDLPTLKMSAKEYREMMIKKREKDARNRAIGFKAKKDAFEQL